MLNNKLGYILLFIVPKGYMMKKDLIHQNLEKVSGQLDSSMNGLYQKIPKYSDLKEE